jgi:uncharacterized protein (TIGR03067 family)
MRIIRTFIALGLWVTWTSIPPSWAAALTPGSAVGVEEDPGTGIISDLEQAGDDTGSPPLERERERHQGTWLVTSFVSDGIEASPEIAGSIRRVVKDNHVVWKRDGKSFAGTTMEVDPAREPKTIDVIPDGGKSRGKRVLGIYKFDGDTLTICMAGVDQERPKEFKAGKGSGRSLMTLKRGTPQR